MGACISTIINACKEIVLPCIPLTQPVPDSEETAPSALSSTVVPYSGEMAPSAMPSIPSTQPSVLSAIPSMQLVPDSEETDPLAMSATAVPDFGEMPPLAMSSNPSTQPSVLSAIPSMQLVPESEETDPSAMSSAVVRDSGEMVPSAISSNPSMQPSVLSSIPSMQLVPDSEETNPSAMSSTVVQDSGEMAPSAMSSIPSTQQSTTGSVASTISSTENASGCGKYEVFINHRGVDTKDSLASTIYHTLDLRGVRAFFDREELEAGKLFSDDIEEAIRSAFVQIAIFSPKYAESRWCLHELTLMLRTGKKIIPIFYNVNPSVLRVAHGSGDYFKAFSKHEKRYTPEELDEWKKALSKASYIEGYEFNEHQNDEGCLVEEIVNEVTKEMKKMALLHVATHPVGLDEAVKNFQYTVETLSQCAQTRQNVKIVGIVGLGGSGKTTLAKEYFNQKRSFYRESSFLLDVRDAAANNGLHYLQRKLLEDLVHIKQEIHHTREGKGALEHRVRSVKALIVLDDVNHINQIESLLPLKGNFQPDSLVIVTTRDSSVIASSASLSPSVSVSVHRMKGLYQVHAKQLFCWHAFLREYPVNGFEDLVNQFSTACQGLPLSLKVLGAQLCGNRSRGYWESLLHKISQILPDDVKQILKVSYDALDEQQQQMFLDVACFFIGESIDTAISIWDGSSSDGVLWSGAQDSQILVNKCLVEVDHQNCIRMHDHLRDLGREIAIKETPSRFWSHSQFLNSRRPLEERLPMRGIMAATGSGSMDGFCNLHYEPPFEECMQLLMGHSTSRSKRVTPSALGLQLLLVEGIYFRKQFAMLSEELVWLRWYDFPHEKLPSWLATGNLRALELYNAKRLARLWEPNDPPASQLRELIIKMAPSCDFQMIPETIGFLKHLKKIVLKPVDRLNSFQMSNLPEEFCLLESLEHLELRYFSNLSSLPTHFGNLRKLKYIDLYGGKRLAALPVSFNQLTELQYLDLSFCENLQLEKDILENITKLEILRLDRCSKLQQLPTEITRQMYLRELCLSQTGLRELPADIDRLARLELLKIGGPCLTSLPTALGNLSPLVSFTIDGCSELTHLRLVGCPTRLDNLQLQTSGVKYLREGFGQLVNLQILHIWNCPIRELPLSMNHMDSSMLKFPRLKQIHVWNTKVSTISIFEDCCPGLEELHLIGNNDLMEIETLPTKLKWVSILHCKKLENLRGVAGLAELQDLEISVCPGLPNFAGLVKLQRLRIYECPQLHKLPSFAGLVKLQTLWIRDCPQLHKLPSFAGLVELRDFSIKKCPQLDEVPSLACCTFLQELELQVSDRITIIEGLEDLRSLERLRLETDWKVPAIKGLKNLDKLTTLQIRAQSRSVIETCIPPNTLKRPCRMRMDIVGRAVEDVESVVGSLSLPNLTVVDKLHPSSKYEWEMKAPLSSASCVIICFVISCHFADDLPDDIPDVLPDGLRGDMGYIQCDQGGDEWGRIRCYASPESCRFLDSHKSPGWDTICIPPSEGKQVYIGVCPKGFHLNEDFMEGSEGVFMTIQSWGDSVQIEKGIAVIMRNGEEVRAVEALHKILELVER